MKKAAEYESMENKLGIYSRFYIRKDDHTLFLPVCMLMIMLFASMLLTGCVQGEREQKKTGLKIMNDYFANTQKKASVNSLYADITRPAADRLEMTDFVKGTFKSGDETYDFWANVETGSIYTNERLKEFGNSALNAVAKKLGMDAQNCTCYASITMYDGFTKEPGNSRGQELSVTLSDVLPVTVTDMDQFTETVLESEDVFVRTFIICRNMPSDYTSGDIELPGWTNGQISICGLNDPSKELPTDKYDILNYWSENKESAIDLKY